MIEILQKKATNTSMGGTSIVIACGPDGWIIRDAGDFLGLPLIHGQGKNLILEVRMGEVDHGALMPHTLHEASVKFSSPLFLQLLSALQEIGLGLGNDFLSRISLNLELVPFGLKLVPLRLGHLQLGLAYIPLDPELVPLRFDRRHSNIHLSDPPSQTINLAVQVALADSMDLGLLQLHPFDNHVLDGPVVGLLALGDVVGRIQTVEFSLTLHPVVDHVGGVVVHSAYSERSIGG